MGFQMKELEEFRDRVGPNMALQAENVQRGKHQANQPGIAFRGFP